MRTLCAALLLTALVAGTAVAQPGQTPPIEPYPAPPAQPYPPPPPQPYAQPQPYPQPPAGYVPAPYQYQPVQVQLTAEEQELLQQGEVSDGQHIGGGLASLFLGLGVGQAVQGRWSETGWIFTLGETASVVSLIVGASKQFNDCFDGQVGCRNQSDGDAYLIAGVVGIVVFRTWEVIDAFAGPPKHNRRVRELRMRVGLPAQPMYGKLTPYMNKTRDGGGTAGVSFHF
jgi:hypothetical protein